MISQKALPVIAVIFFRAVSSDEVCSNLELIYRWGSVFSVYTSAVDRCYSLLCKEHRMPHEVHLPYFRYSYTSSPYFSWDLEATTWMDIRHRLSSFGNGRVWVGKETRVTLMPSACWAPCWVCDVLRAHVILYRTPHGRQYYYSILQMRKLRFTESKSLS